MTNEQAKLIAGAILLAGAMIAIGIAGERLAAINIAAIALFVGGGVGLSALLNFRVSQKK